MKKKIYETMSFCVVIFYLKSSSLHKQGFPKLNLSQIELIELIWMTLGIVKINTSVTSKLPIVKKKLPCDNRISCRQIFTIHSK